MLHLTRSEVVEALVDQGIARPRAENFIQWLCKNRRVFEAFKNVCSELIGRGEKRWSPQGVIAVVRYKHFEVLKSGAFKINNNWTPELARLWRAKFPEHRNFLKIREVKKL